MVELARSDGWVVEWSDDDWAVLPPPVAEALREILARSLRSASGLPIGAEGRADREAAGSMMDTKAPLAHPPADLAKRTATVRGRSSLMPPLLHTGRSPDANAGEDSGLTDRDDQVAAFGSAVLAIRWCMTVASVAFAAAAFVEFFF